MKTKCTSDEYTHDFFFFMKECEIGDKQGDRSS